MAGRALSEECGRYEKRKELRFKPQIAQIKQIFYSAVIIVIAKSHSHRHSTQCGQITNPTERRLTNLET